LAVVDFGGQPLREVSAMTTKLAKSLVILSSLALVGFASTTALADKIKESGSFDAAYVKRDAQPIPDQDGHMLSLTDAQGANKNTSGTGYLDGFSVNIRDFADLVQGNGPHQGYVIYVKDPDQQVIKIEGMVTTTMKDGKPNTTVKGNWVVVNGKGALAETKGEGTYSGYFTAEDKYHVDWEGTRTAPKDSLAESKK
jgi:hypothetical protein